MIQFREKNGRVGSSKLSFPHRNIKKTSRNYEKQLSQNFGKQSKVYSNQAGNEWGKRQLQNSGKALWSCYLSLPQAFSGMAGVVAHGQCGTLVPGPRENKADPIYKLLCMSVLTCLGVIWSTDTRYLSPFHLTQTKARKARGIIQKHWKPN